VPLGARGSGWRGCGEGSSGAYELGGSAGTGWSWGGQGGLELGGVPATFGSCRSVGFGDPESLGRASARRASATCPSYRGITAGRARGSAARCCPWSGSAAGGLLAFLEGVFAAAAAGLADEAAFHRSERPASLRRGGLSSVSPLLPGSL